MILRSAVCGFQTGVDQVAARAAVAVGLPIGGWMPLGYLTEDGPRPQFAQLYNAREMPTADYAARTRANARDSTGTAWLGPVGSAGFRATERACIDLGRPFVVVPEGARAGWLLMSWIEGEEIDSLNVAGSRESKARGIGAKSEAFLTAVFAKILAGDS